MKRLNITSTTLRIAASGAIALTLTTGEAFAQWPVMDSMANSRLAETTASQKRVEQSMTEVEKNTKEASETLGEAGPHGPGELSPSSDPFYETLEKYAFDPCAINLCQVGTNYTNEQDYDRALKWVQRNYFANTPLSPEDERDLQEVRRRAVIYATTGSLAMTTIVHNSLAEAGSEADALEAQVENSDNMRSDIAVNSMVMLAAYKLEVQKLAVLTSMLEVEAARAMTMTSPYFEKGGSSFPDSAFEEDDYGGGTDFNNRVKVSIPAKGTATPAPATP